MSQEILTTTTTTSIEIVISRFEESLDFIKQKSFASLFEQYQDQINIQYTIYNKGASLIDDTFPYNNNTIIPLKNVGKCDHTYLYHIIHNYDSLSELTLFLPGSCMEMDYKIAKTLQTIQTMLSTKRTTFCGFFIPGLEKVESFQLDTWTTSSKENQSHHSRRDSQLVPASIRPFGKWHRAVFGEQTPLNFICYNGIFAVHRDDIRKHPKSYYESILAHVDNIANPEAGHYIERSWVSIFGPLSVLDLHVFIW